MEHNSTILAVDDEQIGRELIEALLIGRGYNLVFAKDGTEALEKASQIVPDLILLDVMMPGMDGFEVCRRLRTDPLLAEVPIIMVTALGDRDSRLRGIESGVDDFITKPFDQVELRARVQTITRLSQNRRRALEALRKNMAETEHLLLNILPKPIAERLKQDQGVIADRFDEVTILFADIVGFTKFAVHASPTELVALLNEIFSVFDRLTERYGLEKIKTIGDKYMVAGGLPTPRRDHVEAIAEIALDMQHEVALYNQRNNRQFSIRIGINTGPVVAGVIGVKKFIYDLWGDTVNLASRMETQGVEGRIQVTEATYNHLQDKYLFEKRGMIQVRNRGEIDTYFLRGRKTE